MEGQFQCDIDWSACPSVKYGYVADGPNRTFKMPCVQNISIWNNDVGNSLTLAWHNGSGKKGQNHPGTQEMLGAGGRGKQGVNDREGKLQGCSCLGWSPASPCPAARLVFLSPDACQRVVCGWNFLFASGLQELCIWRIDRGRVALWMRFEMQLCNFYFGCTCCD